MKIPKPRRQTVFRTVNQETHRSIRAYAAHKRIPLMVVMEACFGPVVLAMKGHKPGQPLANDPFPELVSGDRQEGETWEEFRARRRRMGNPAA